MNNYIIQLWAYHRLFPIFSVTGIVHTIIRQCFAYILTYKSCVYQFHPTEKCIYLPLTIEEMIKDHSSLSPIATPNIYCTSIFTYHNFLSLVLLWYATTNNLNSNYTKINKVFLKCDPLINDIHLTPYYVILICDSPHPANLNQFYCFVISKIIVVYIVTHCASLRQLTEPWVVA